MKPKPLVIGHGQETNLVERLGGEVDIAYYSTNLDAFPSVRETAPGVGFKGVERIDDPLTYMLDGRASHVIVPDLYLNGYERLARQLEIPTFGSGDGNRLETDREFMLDFLAEHNLAVPESTIIHGLDALALYLKGQKDKYIKVSNYRGDMETEHWTDWESKQPWLNRLKVRLGPIGEMMTFIVQEPIESVCEVGIDHYFGGKGWWRANRILGVEKKDDGYVGYLIAELPESMEPMFDALGDYFEDCAYNNFFSNEMRITKDGTVYMTDATCRIPSPPGGVMMHAAKNFPNVVLKGESPDYGDAEYFCEIVLKSDHVRKDFLRVDFPKDLHYAFHNHCIIDSKTWVVPHGAEYEEFGSALGWGSTLDEAAEMANEAAKALTGDGVHYDDHVLEKAESEIEKGRSCGL